MCCPPPGWMADQLPPAMLALLQTGWLKQNWLAGCGSPLPEEGGHGGEAHDARLCWLLLAGPVSCTACEPAPLVNLCLALRVNATLLVNPS